MLHRLLHATLILALATGAALAELAPPRSGTGITLDKVGIYCRMETDGREAAPDTDLGYIQILAATPEFVFEQREVPARLGISFGVMSTSDRDILDARIEVYRPDTPKPDVWYSTFVANSPMLRGFSFDFAHELVPGIWRFAAFDGDIELYSVEFEVLPGSELPGISSDCNLLS